MEWKNFIDWLETELTFLGGLTIGELLVDIISIVGIYFAAKFLIWLINIKILNRFFRKNKVDSGRQYALRQTVLYLIWALAVFAILEILGISNMILASSAALLVGIGLGLQSTFRDLLSGVIILIEGTTEVGDIIEVEGQVAVVTKIGLRVSTLNTRDQVNIITPNSKLVTESVVNWSHEDFPTRFLVEVGVAYGSDLALVKKLLAQAASEHEKVLPSPAPFIHFKAFGEFSLKFELYFFSYDFFRIEFVKSDLRFAIEKLFKENGVRIPFPQRDLWLRNAEELK